jgi:hypothetical protein
MLAPFVLLDIERGDTELQHVKNAGSSKPYRDYNQILGYPIG